MSNLPENKSTEPQRSQASDPRAPSAEGHRIATIASQLSAEDVEQLRQYIDRHHPKPFQ